jgi:hypothetical protein
MNDEFMNDESGASAFFSSSFMVQHSSFLPLALPWHGGCFAPSGEIAMVISETMNNE